MNDLDQLLPLWRELRERGIEYVLATVVAVEGSGYRKPGARMLVTADGRRAGTISGGCLEGEVARKAFWHTENGPVLRRYSTTAEDGEVPYGMGCGGIIHLLLEREATANPLMELLARHFAERHPIAIATVLEGDRIGERAYCSPLLTGAGEMPAVVDAMHITIESLAGLAFDEQRSFMETVQSVDGQVAGIRAEWSPARTGIFLFGAGDDAIPVVRQARQLGWYVALADGRSQLATQGRFPEAETILVLETDVLTKLDLRPTDTAVIMTHSIEQDVRILGHLLAHTELAYVGILGPRHRTTEVLRAIAEERNVSPSRVDAQIDLWMDRLHAPIGLDLGGNAPADIALSVIAEVQQTLHRASAQSLSQIRARALKNSSERQDRATWVR